VACNYSRRGGPQLLRTSLNRADNGSARQFVRVVLFQNMRIIAGLYKGRVLKGPQGGRTRPTSDRLRESVFSILAPRIDGHTRVLDLCAGTGAVGIEALSRGAGHAVFVDKSRKSCALVEANLDLVGVPDEATEVIMSAAEDFVRRGPREYFDIIFFDPPYGNDYVNVIRSLGEPDSKILKTDGILIVEHHFKNPLPDLQGTARRWRVLKQGESQLSFYERV
jgi:16S rRNA (guanine966-N2)-methyltransferase